MGEWTETFNALPADAQERVVRWIHLNKFVAQTLRMSWEDWMTGYLQPAMAEPMDYGFIEKLFPDVATFSVEGATFSRESDPALAAVARVPLRAKNNLGRFSAGLQEQLAALLEVGEPDSIKISPGDVAILQKILPKERALAKLPKSVHRKISIARVKDDVVLMVEGSPNALLRITVLEFGAILSRSLV